MALFTLHKDQSNISHQNLVNEDNENADDFMKNASKGRAATDIAFIIGHAICIGLLGILIVYCKVTGDIDRITNGNDHCGNVCGKKNYMYILNTDPCVPMDMSDKPYLSLLENNGECVKNCTDGVLFLNRCIGSRISKRHALDNWLFYILVNIYISTWEIVGITFLTVLFAFTAMLILRYFTAVFVLSSIGGTILLLTAMTGFSWYMVKYEDGFIMPAIMLPVATFIIIVVVIWLRNRIELVIQLFKESAKSLTCMPLLFVPPVMTFIAIAVTFSAWIYFTLLIVSTGTPVASDDGQVQFIPNSFIKFIHFYNCFIMLWLVLFMYGCQNMLIAGAVTRWYFIRNKGMLVNPILKSGVTMLKYHLGTISIGSLTITLIKMFRLFWFLMRRRFRAMSYFCCLCFSFETLNIYIGSLVYYINLNMYAVCAIHGTTFYKSGKRAFDLLVNNMKNVIAVNSIGDFVIVLTKVLIVGIPVAIGYFVLKNKDHINIAVPLVVIALIALVVAQCFVTVLEMTIITTFICFCEDCEINDGVLRPYYMSQNLMDFIDKSKAVLNVQDPI